MPIPANQPIQHIFVVVLENRSFDHMLGLSGITGTDAKTGAATQINGIDPQDPTQSNKTADGTIVAPTGPALFAMPNDPGHEFEQVYQQLTGAAAVPDLGQNAYAAINNSGFIASYAGVTPAADPKLIMQCFQPGQLTVLNALAKEFAVCDNWFSAIPGPTWPNRFFFHAASSGGLDHSPSDLQVLTSTFIDGYSFEHGTIYDRLNSTDPTLNPYQAKFAVYHGDSLPQVMALKGINGTTPQLRPYANFAADLMDPNFAPNYIFIEPSYGHVITDGGDMKCGTSQHPLDDVTRGDAFLRDIYLAIRNSPLWPNSLLIITYDEHGGFYDHVAPPTTTAPGDATTSNSNNKFGFDFTQFGVRVPAVIVSPWIPKNTVDHTVYDHSSVLATVETLFNLDPLTARDGSANYLTHLMSLPAARTDAPTTIVPQANSGIPDCYDMVALSHALIADSVTAAPNAPAPEPLKGGMALGFAHIALKRDLQITPPAERQARIDRFRNMKTTADAAGYIREVRAKLAGQNVGITVKSAAVPGAPSSASAPSTQSN